MTRPMLILILMLVPLTAVAQTAKSNRWVNPEETCVGDGCNKRVPVIFGKPYVVPKLKIILIDKNTGKPAAGAKLCNTATVQLTQYQIGCIERRDDRFEIVRKDELVNDRIDGRGGCITLENTNKDFPFDECTEGKLAVIEVVFADGTNWSLQARRSR